MLIKLNVKPGVKLSKITEITIYIILGTVSSAVSHNVGAQLVFAEFSLSFLQTIKTLIPDSFQREKMSNSSLVALESRC